MKKTKNIIDNFPMLLLTLMTLGMFTNDTQGILNISATLLLFFSLYRLISKKINPIHDIVSLVKNRKVFFIYNAWCLICIFLFTYSDLTAQAFKEFFNDWRYTVVLVLFYLSRYKSENEIKNTITNALIITLAFIVTISPILKTFKPSDSELFLQLRYGFAHYTTLVYPFAFIGLFLSKNIYLKATLLLLSIGTFIFILYTGSRGGMLAILFESGLIIFILSANIKRFFLYSSFLILAISIIFTIAYITIPQVKQKTIQTVTSTNITSNRDEIISVRFPVIMGTARNQIVGLGYGSVAYNSYLNDNNVKNINGESHYSEKKKMMTHNNDEPFFLNIAYNIGYVGLFLFCAAFIVNMKDLLRSFKQRKDILNVGIFVSSIGYFLVYCLFEFIFLDIFILYNILTAILINNVLVKK